MDCGWKEASGRSLLAAADVRDKFEHPEHAQANFYTVSGIQLGGLMRFLGPLHKNQGRDPAGNGAKQRSKQDDFAIQGFHVSAILQYGYLKAFPDAPETLPKRFYGCPAAQQADLRLRHLIQQYLGADFDDLKVGMHQMGKGRQFMGEPGDEIDHGCQAQTGQEANHQEWNYHPNNGDAGPLG